MLVYANQRVKRAASNESNFTFLQESVNGYVAGSTTHICKNNVYHT